MSRYRFTYGSLTWRYCAASPSARVSSQWNIPLEKNYFDSRSQDMESPLETWHEHSAR